MTTLHDPAPFRTKRIRSAFLRSTTAAEAQADGDVSSVPGMHVPPVTKSNCAFCVVVVVVLVVVVPFVVEVRVAPCHPGK